MRTATLFLVLVIAINVSSNLAGEMCPIENCLAPNKCETTLPDAVCANKQKTCCSIVKSEFRTACRHHGGECLDECNQVLQRSVTDCSGKTVCCVLV